MGGEADCVGDHRLAMAFAVAALGAAGPSTILGSDAVAVSYPGFFEVLGAVCR
jgi:3-phosphoshikimate 1-carboxyvinyltransferase